MRRWLPLAVVGLLWLGSLAWVLVAFGPTRTTTAILVLGALAALAAYLSPR